MRQWMRLLAELDRRLDARPPWQGALICSCTYLVFGILIALFMI